MVHIHIHIHVLQLFMQHSLCFHCPTQDRIFNLEFLKKINILEIKLKLLKLLAHLIVHLYVSMCCAGVTINIPGHNNNSLIISGYHDSSLLQGTFMVRFEVHCCTWNGFQNISRCLDIFSLSNFQTKLYKLILGRNVDKYNRRKTLAKSNPIQYIGLR